MCTFSLWFFLLWVKTYLLLVWEWGTLLNVFPPPQSNCSLLQSFSPGSPSPIPPSKSCIIYSNRTCTNSIKALIYQNYDIIYVWLPSRVRVPIMTFKVHLHGSVWSTDTPNYWLRAGNFAPTVRFWSDSPNWNMF